MTDNLEEIKKRIHTHALLELELPKANRDSIIAIEQLVIIQEHYYSDVTTLLEEIESLRSQLEAEEAWKAISDEQKELKKTADECMIAAFSIADKLLEANTAMREALEWYAHTDLGTRAEDLLSRYLKEGEDK